MLVFNTCTLIIIIIIPTTSSFSSYRPPAQYPAEDLNPASSYGSGCGCGYGKVQGSYEPDYIVITSLVLGAVGWLAVAAAAFAALFLQLQGGGGGNRRSLGGRVQHHAG